MREIKVSIIVPVYNVEQYIDHCLTSLIHQTYKNFDILVVDDGSTDGSAERCDYYASKYSFISVFHKENGGLSSARNYALPYATGGYISFVDSDDYVETTYLADMLSVIDSEEIDMVTAQYYHEFPNRNTINRKQGSTKILTSEQALELLCYDYSYTSACGKLISTKIASKFPFPDGKLYEDLATIYKMLSASRKIVLLEKQLYHYVQRAGSIMRTNSWKTSTMDVMEAASGLLNHIVMYYPHLYRGGVFRYIFAAQTVYKQAYKEKNYLQLIKKTQLKMKEYWPIVRKDRRVPFYQKVKFYLMIFAPKLYRSICIVLSK